MKDRPTVFVIDDDPDVLDSLSRLVRTASLGVECFDSADAFLVAWREDRPGCLVTDIRMPGMNGLELQERMRSQGPSIPTIVLTGYGDVPGAVRALKGGAIDFLQKPYEPDVLLVRIAEALEKDARTREARERTAEVEARLSQLTPREREVMSLVVEGRANKVIAIDLGISERTIELHRGRVMRKLGARSVPDLIRKVGLKAGSGTHD